jgi:hypothetical protein
VAVARTMGTCKVRLAWTTRKEAQADCRFLGMI